MPVMTIVLPILHILLFSLAYAAGAGAPWVPTFKHDIERVRRLLDVKDGETFVELGCGDGRVVFGVAGEGGRPKAERREGRRESKSLSASDPSRLRPLFIGVELSLIQWLVAQIRRMVTRTWNTRFVLGNLFSHNLHDADAVYFFLLPETYEKLRPKLEAELRPGTRVVSAVWPVVGWTPEKIDEADGASKMYLYVR